MKKKLIFSAIFLIFLIFCIAIIFDFKKDKYFFVSDNYDLPGYSSTGELLERKNLNDDLKSLYKSFKGNQDFEYLELYDYFLQYRGEYHNGDNFVENPNKAFNKAELKEVIEQRCLISGQEELLTNIYGFFIGKKEFDDYLSPAQIIEGRSFESEDYIIRDNIINVILGNNYREIYNTGDNFQAYYMGEKSTFEVIGFLKRGAEINVAATAINFDDYVLAPAFNEIPNDTSNYNKSYETSHYINKITNGLIKTNGYKDASKTISKFNNMVNNLDLEYSCMEIN